MVDLKISDKSIAIITGAGGAIGRAIAINLAKKNYNLALVDVLNEEIQKTIQAIKENCKDYKQKLIPFNIDISIPNQVNKTIARIVSNHYKIELLFNVAGVVYPYTTEASIEEFHKLMKVNLFGAFYWAKAVAPYMKKFKKGYIFNLGSLASKHVHPDLGIYATSKFGLLGLTEALQKELAEHGIKVTVLCPSFVDTPLVNHINLPREYMLKIDDIIETINFLLRLSKNANIKEIAIELDTSLINNAKPVLKPL